MTLRREIRTLAFGTATAATPPRLTLAQDTPSPVSATAITRVFGHGLRLFGAALAYEAPVDGPSLSPSASEAGDRTVTSTDPADAAPEGRFVPILPDPEDAGARLRSTVGRKIVRDAAEAHVAIDGASKATGHVGTVKRLIDSRAAAH